MANLKIRCAANSQAEQPVNSSSSGGQNRSSHSKHWELGFEILDGNTQISQLEVLSHQSNVSSKVEIFIGQGSSYSSAKFSRLGFLSLGSSEGSSRQAHELKTTFMDNIGNTYGSFIKIIITRNSVPDHDTHIATDIIAVSVLRDGDEEDRSAHSTDLPADRDINLNNCTFTEKYTLEQAESWAAESMAVMLDTPDTDTVTQQEQPQDQKHQGVAGQRGEDSNQVVAVSTSAVPPKSLPAKNSKAQQPQPESKSKSHSKPKHSEVPSENILRRSNRSCVVRGTQSAQVSSAAQSNKHGKRHSSGKKGSAELETNTAPRDHSIAHSDPQDSPGKLTEQQQVRGGAHEEAHDQLEHSQHLEPVPRRGGPSLNVIVTKRSAVTALETSHSDSGSGSSPSGRPESPNSPSALYHAGADTELALAAAPVSGVKADVTSAAMNQGQAEEATAELTIDNLHHDYDPIACIRDADREYQLQQVEALNNNLDKVWEGVNYDGDKPPFCIFVPCRGVVILDCSVCKLLGEGGTCLNACHDNSNLVKIAHAHAKEIHDKLPPPAEKPRKCELDLTETCAVQHSPVKIPAKAPAKAIATATATAESTASIAPAAAAAATAETKKPAPKGVLKGPAPRDDEKRAPRSVVIVNRPRVAEALPDLAIVTTKAVEKLRQEQQEREMAFATDLGCSNYDELMDFGVWLKDVMKNRGLTYQWGEPRRVRKQHPASGRYINEEVSLRLFRLPFHMVQVLYDEYVEQKKVENNKMERLYRRSLCASVFSLIDEVKKATKEKAVDVYRSLVNRYNAKYRVPTTVDLKSQLRFYRRDHTYADNWLPATLQFMQFARKALHCKLGFSTDERGDRLMAVLDAVRVKADEEEDTVVVEASAAATVEGDVIAARSAKATALQVQQLVRAFCINPEHRPVAATDASENINELRDWFETEEQVLEAVCKTLVAKQKYRKCRVGTLRAALSRMLSGTALPSEVSKVDLVAAELRALAQRTLRLDLIILNPTTEPVTADDVDFHGERPDADAAEEHVSEEEAPAAAMAEEDEEDELEGIKESMQHLQVQEG